MIDHKSKNIITVIFLTNWQTSAASRPIQKKEQSAPETGNIYYVAKSGNGLGGMSWTDAYTNVQDALAAAVTPAEIWVAAGVYYPDEGSGQLNDAVSSSIVLTDGLSLYGGFDTSDVDFSEWDWKTNLTVLSGDIDQNDITDVNQVVTDVNNISGDNAYHVLYARNLTGTAVIDGFTVTAAKAFGPDPHFKGGGFYCDGSGTGNYCNPTVLNITFSGNEASDGGAMYNDGSQGGNSSPYILNSTFIYIDANDGGALFNDGQYEGESSPNLTKVRFIKNSGSYGGAMFNSGYQGGGSSPKITDAIFMGQFTDDEGGVMYNEGDLGICIPVITNALFAGNYSQTGGVLFNTGHMGNSSPIITNSTFSGNSTNSDGAVMRNRGTGGGKSAPDVRSSIFWNNMEQNVTGTISATFFNESATITFTNSIVQGSLTGGIWVGGVYVDSGGNLDEDPQFVAGVDPSNAPTTEGDYRLQSTPPAIDAGNNSFITGIFSDLDG